MSLRETFDDLLIFETTRLRKLLIAAGLVVGPFLNWYTYCNQFYWGTSFKIIVSVIVYLSYITVIYFPLREVLDRFSVVINLDRWLRLFSHFLIWFITLLVVGWFQYTLFHVPILHYRVPSEVSVVLFRASIYSIFAAVVLENLRCQSERP